MLPLVMSQLVNPSMIGGVLPWSLCITIALPWVRPYTCNLGLGAMCILCIACALFLPSVRIWDSSLTSQSGMKCVKNSCNPSLLCLVNLVVYKALFRVILVVVVVTVVVSVLLWGAQGLAVASQLEHWVRQLPQILMTPKIVKSISWKRKFLIWKKMKSKDKQCYRLKRSLSALKDFVGIKNMKGLSKKKIMKQQQEKKSLRMLNISKRGVSERNLTPSGVVAVGLRMALSCCSALGFPSASWTDISRQTVSRCEVNVAACCALRGAMIGHFMMHMMKTSQDNLFRPPCMMPSVARKLLVLDHIQLPDDNGDDHTAFRARVACVLSMFNIPASVCGMFSCNMVDVSSPCVVGLSFQNDATNSNIWQKRKLTTAVVHAGMLTDRNALETSNYRSAFFVDAFMFLVVWISSSAIIIISFFVLILYHCTMVLLLQKMFESLNGWWLVATFWTCPAVSICFIH